MKIYLDDKRIPPDDSWTLVETFQDFVRVYDETPNVEAVSFDHDLGMLSQGDGNDALAHIEMSFVNGRTPPRDLRCHSANPVGRAEIERGIARLRERIENAY